jgi:hypothetical protein
MSAERSARLPALPLIAISPSGQWTLEAPLGTRPSVLLPEPVSTARFAQAVKQFQAGAQAAAA